VNYNNEIALRCSHELVIARKALEEAETLAEITPLMDKADILKTMARKAKLSRDAQNDWAEYKLDAERKAGAILKKLKDDGSLPAGRPKVSDSETVTTLDTLEITRTQSSNWQKLADLPEDEYVEYKTQTRAKGKEITEAGAVAKAKHREREIQKKERAKEAAIIAAEVATVQHCSYADWLPTQPDCDLLLTDPPYSTDVDDITAFANNWLPIALAR